MPRLLILIILVYLLYLVGKRFFALLKIHQARQAARDAHANRKNSTEKVVKCAVCGTHVPEHDAVLTNAEWVCKQPCQP